MSQQGKGDVKQGITQEVGKEEEKEQGTLEIDENDEWGDILSKEKDDILIGYANVDRLWIKPKKVNKKKKKKEKEKEIQRKKNR